MSEARESFVKTYRVEPHTAVVEDGQVDSEEGLESATAVLVTPGLSPAIAIRPGDVSTVHLLLVSHGVDDSLEREVGVQSDGHAVPSTGRLHAHLELSVQFILTENIHILFVFKHWVGKITEILL